jgi:cation transport ATPase
MINFSSKEQRKNEERLYSIVVNQIEQNEINKALWAKSLSDSGNNESTARALYIKYMVQKIKDEESDERDLKYKQQKLEEEAKNNQKKTEESIIILETKGLNVLSTFKWLSSMVLIFGVIGLFLSYISYSEDTLSDSIVILSVFLLVLGFYLFFQIYKISKITDIKENRKRINTLFFVLIPLSFIFSVICMAFVPLFGIGLFFVFIGIIIKAIKFNKAFRFAKKNQLI